MKLYKRFCKGTFAVGTLVDKDSTLPIDKINDYYESIYYYTEEQKKVADEMVENNKGQKRRRGVAGVTDVVTDRLLWDLDSATDLNKAKKDTITLCDRLVSEGFTEDSLRICFSGKKGFSVDLHTNDQFTPEQFKNITSKLAEGLETYDSVVANPSRVIRVPNTKHKDTGLFKTAYKLADIKELSIDDIKEYSNGTYDTGVANKWKSNVSVPEKIDEIKNMTIPKVKKENTSNLGPVSKLRVNYRENPFNFSPWKLAISQGIFPSGCRSNALMILASNLKSKGLSKMDCYYILKSSADKQSQIFDSPKFDKEEIWENIIDQVYSDSWTGGTYTLDNFPEQLKSFLESMNIPETNASLVDANAIVKIDDVYDSFEDFAVNIDKNTIKTGIKELDDLCQITTSMMVGVLGSPASGKTSCLLNVLNHMSLTGEESIFFSLDMGKQLVYQKLATRCTDYTKDDVYYFFKNENEEKKQEIREKIHENFANVNFCFKTGSSAEDIKQYIKEYEVKTGKKVRMIAVDYLEKVVGPYSDQTANSGYVAKMLNDIAKDLNITVFLLLQPQKMAGDPSKPLLSYRNVKGSSLLEQEARVIISLWREGFSPQSYEDDKYMTMAVLKNSMGEMGTIDLGWDGVKGRVYPLADWQKQELKEYRKTKELLSDIEKKDW